MRARTETAELSRAEQGVTKCSQCWSTMVWHHLYWEREPLHNIALLGTMGHPSNWRLEWGCRAWMWPTRPVRVWFNQTWWCYCSLGVLRMKTVEPDNCEHVEDCSRQQVSTDIMFSLEFYQFWKSLRSLKMITFSVSFQPFEVLTGSLQRSFNKEWKSSDCFLSSTDMLRWFANCLQWNCKPCSTLRANNLFTAFILMTFS